MPGRPERGSRSRRPRFPLGGTRTVSKAARPAGVHEGGERSSSRVLTALGGEAGWAGGRNKRTALRKRAARGHPPPTESDTEAQLAPRPLSLSAGARAAPRLLATSAGYCPAVGGVVGE